MADNSRIEWTDATWNPITGCTKVSLGCDHCYAERIVERFKGKGAFSTVQLNEERLTAPLKWSKPRRVFVNSTSDLFHDSVPDEYIGSVFDVMGRTPQHTYQILTKRHGRMRSLLNRWADDGWTWRRHDKMWCGPIPGPLPNVWLGVSVENQQWADIRIPALLDTPAAVRWLSMEPLLGPVTLPFEAEANTCTCYGGTAPYGHEPGCGLEPGPAWGNLHWVVVGGESGPGARPMAPGWARSLRDQCTGAGVPFFFKQWGEWLPHPGGSFPRSTLTRIDGTWFRRFGKKAAGRELDGRTWDEYPAA